MSKLPSLSALGSIGSEEIRNRPLEEYFEECPTFDNEEYINDWSTTGWTGMFHLDLVLSYAIERGASDIHINAGQPVAFTILGDIYKQSDFAIPDTFIMDDLVNGILNHQSRDVYIQELEYDTSYEIKYGLYKKRRFRVSIGRSLDASFIVFRTISDKIPHKSELDIEPEVEEWFHNSSGAVLVCGATGSGKAIHKDTLVPNPKGLKPVKDYIVGDKIFDKDGNVEEIIAIHQADNTDKFYKIVFNNGEVIKATGRHPWLIFTDKGMLKEVDTDYMVRNKEYKYVLPKAPSISEFDTLSIPKRTGVLKELMKAYKTIGEENYLVEDKEDYQAILTYANSLGYWVNVLSEKALHIPEKVKVKMIVIKSIEKIDDDYNDYYCFEVSGKSHTYLIGESFIPTHNSTTMASILREIQLTENKKIITIEKPIEALFPSDGKSLVVQRAIPEDCLSFDAGLTSAMRQNPDYILIGEIRNKEEVNEFLRAAETGHLAMSTIHTVNNVSTLNRIRSLFNGDEQRRVLATLGDVLRGIVNQVLVKTPDGKGRFAVREYITIDYTIRKLIADDNFAEIRRIQESKGATMEQKLAKTVLEGRCTYEEAVSKAPDRLYFEEVYHKMNMNLE